MGTVEMALLMELVVVPVIKRLAQDRGIHGVTAETIEGLDTKDVIAALKADSKLADTVTDDLADTVDNIVSSAVDAFFGVLIAVNSGVKRSDDT